MRLLWRFAALSLPLCVAASAGAQPSEVALVTRRAPEAEAEPAPTPSESRSLGTTNRGRLRESVEITGTPHLVVREGPRDARYGIAELVGLISRAAAQVSVAHPGPRLLVGDLSRRRGGRLYPHRSHRSGRDVDLGFYLLDADGDPVESERFINLRRSGCGRWRGERYCFDAARNWALVVALLDDPVARVQYVLVTPYLRRRLLAEGERQHAPAEVIERVRLATRPHRGSRSHRSHFHVRIYCPIDDRPACIDEPPYHGWYEGTPSPRARAVARRRARIRRARARRRAARRRARD